jgi:hypothetical protein
MNPEQMFALRAWGRPRADEEPRTTRIALVFAALVGVLGVLAFMAPATVAPSPLSDAEVEKLLAATAATLPGPDAPARPARMTFTLAAVTCLASSEVLQSTAITGEASSSCPAPVDHISTMAMLLIWAPDRGRWEIASHGGLTAEAPYGTPGKALTSAATSTCRTAYFTVLGYHQARLGDETATTQTEAVTKHSTCGAGF